MHRARLFVAITFGGVVVVMAAVISLMSAQPASAQCGSQASSCKNCHETQNQDPVNNDGTGWHQSHAFGDFCYICHGGNNQATDETAAHAGMVAPLADVQVACGQCHPNDLQARAEVYAVKLGVTVGASAGQTPVSSPTAASPTTAPASASSPTAALPAGVSPGSANLTDYVVRYNAEVLHRQPTNWGNIILGVMLVVLLLAGAFFVNRCERWVSISLSERKPLEEDLPADVAGIADQVARLNPAARRSLARLLEKPGATTQLLSAIDKLSPDEPPDDSHRTESSREG